ncbi:hypothetical protein ASPZODRAFT_134956 [Penicilliopsis zonata CBS 506.65]|uniref:Uncharacterized protein n=1 Tax=Penicilliopsis zonata CBS 506.65 TaxID=1073090 RepID=A0A1L9SCD6_9EURO|nr:hypothetical protein ASPZODRAFT_134956 [Penicilliopsis zonata CBS 506.65]OJJ44814.1 hypothetical protein ASPZODRAFT_134956 [Penicilliopsis zonata CBS 506.65]
MSKVFKAFKKAIVKEGEFKKFFRKHTPGSRIFPPKAGNNDATFQLRFDAGEVVNGMKNVYLQVNSQATNDALKKFRGKHGTHANIATAQIKEDTPPEEQQDVINDMLDQIEDQFKEIIN